MDEAARIARKLSALVELGFERVDHSPVTTEAVRVDRKSYKVTSGKPAMGTFVSVSAVHPSRDRAEEAIGRAFQQMDRLIGVFNRYEGSSAVSHLNREGRLEDAPSEVLQVVARALYYNQLSRGAFDISVQPLVDLFRECLSGEAPTEPTPERVLEAMRLVGSQNVELSRRAIHFRREGMGVTLDGIAKGYIVDRLAEVLARHKVRNYLINAGGDVRTAGTKEGGDPWTVAVQDPAKSGAFPDVIHLRDAAVATSGSYEIYFDREHTFHHIVDAGSGRSPDLNTSVSVVAPTGMAADALATGVFVMEPQEGVRYIDSLPGCECLVIDKHGHRLKSKGWRSAAQPHQERAGSE
jgi:thiamine biosynthesis lipoprotein